MLFAYLDPATGSVVAQVVIGVVVGAGVLIRAYWTKIKKLFGKKTNTNSDLRAKTSNKDESK